MSGRPAISFVNFASVSVDVDRVCCTLLRSFLVRNWCGRRTVADRRDHPQGSTITLRSAPMGPAAIIEFKKTRDANACPEWCVPISIPDWQDADPRILRIATYSAARVIGAFPHCAPLNQRRAAPPSFCRANSRSLAINLREAEADHANTNAAERSDSAGAAFALSKKLEVSSSTGLPMVD